MGDVIDLSINRHQLIKSESIIKAIEGLHLFRYRTPNGFLKQHVVAQLNFFGISTTIFDAFVKPGDQVWLLIPKGQNATLILNVDDELVDTKLFE